MGGGCMTQVNAEPARPHTISSRLIDCEILSALLAAWLLQIEFNFSSKKNLKALLIHKQMDLIFESLPFYRLKAFEILYHETKK